MNLRPTDYESVALPLSYTGSKRNLTLLLVLFDQLTNTSGPESKLDPQLRSRLMKEFKSPFRGVRRVVWIALFGSSCIGLLVMSIRASSGEIVPLSDAGIQVSAITLFGCLLFFDRQRNK